jgi:hypothetical protein
MKRYRYMKYRYMKQRNQTILIYQQLPMTTRSMVMKEQIAHLEHSLSGVKKHICGPLSGFRRNFLSRGTLYRLFELRVPGFFLFQVQFWISNPISTDILSKKLSK